MIDNLVIAYEEEAHFLITEEVYVKCTDDVWVACYHDEDELVLEDSKKGIFLEENIEYHEVMISIDDFVMIKALYNNNTNELGEE